MLKNYFSLIAMLFLISSCIQMNQEDLNFISQYEYIQAIPLKHEIDSNNLSAICVIISPSCSGADNFSPKVSVDLQRFEKDNIQSYLIIDMLNTASSEQMLVALLNKHGIQQSPKIIDFRLYPQDFKLFPASERKKKYSKFLTDLCQRCNDQSLGYPNYVYFKNGEYIGHSYYLSEDLYELLKNTKQDDEKR